MSITVDMSHVYKEHAMKYGINAFNSLLKTNTGLFLDGT